MNIEDSLRLALAAEKHCHRKDNEYLLAERDYWRRRAIYRRHVPQYKFAYKAWVEELTAGLRGEA